MKILFVCSGNSIHGISPIVKAQGESLKKCGIDVSYFPIRGRGFKGYYRNIKKLREHVSQNKYCLIHAHYSLSGVLSSLSNAKNIIVSLMGSDVFQGMLYRLLIRIFYVFSWKHIIVKSEGLRDILGIQKVTIIPNGIDIDAFKPIDKHLARKLVGYKDNGRIISWISDPDRKEKNFRLAQSSIDLLKDPNLHLKIIQDVPHNLMPLFISASDVILQTSLWEGSPNVIKEAMSCNIPVVATDVGDNKFLFRETVGYYICNFKPEDVAKKIILALHTEEALGRDRIKSLQLDSRSIATRLIEVYRIYLPN